MVKRTCNDFFMLERLSRATLLRVLIKIQKPAREVEFKDLSQYEYVYKRKSFVPTLLPTAAESKPEYLTFKFGCKMAKNFAELVASHMRHVCSHGTRTISWTVLPA